MNNSEKLFIKNQIKLAKVFKAVISAGLVVPVFVSVSACKENIPVSVESREVEVVFSGLEIEGLETIFQNGRWEYVDQDDGLVAGYWDDKEGRYEHTASILKGEWKGLFVNAIEKKNEVRASLKENDNWTIDRWEQGKIKLLLPFEMKLSVIVEEKKALGIVKEGVIPKVLLVSGLLSDTLIYAPFTVVSDNISIRMPNSESSISGLTIDVGNNQPILDIWFKNLEQKIDNDDIEQEEPPIKFGVPFLRVDKDDVLTRKSLIVINPFLKGEYQILFSAFNSNASGLPIDFSFKNLLRDKEGRFIYLNSSCASFYGNNE